MIRTKRRTVITVQTERQLLIRGGRGSGRAWCPACAADVEVLSLTEAVAWAGVSPGIIYHWVREGNVHCAKQGAAQPWICVNSLTATISEWRRET